MALLSACGFFGDKEKEDDGDLFASSETVEVEEVKAEEEEDEKELPEFEERVDIDKEWSRGIGSQGDEGLQLKLKPAIDEGVIYATDG